MTIEKQLRVRIENRTGTLAELCSELAKRAVNIHAIHASPEKPVGDVLLIVSHADAAKRVLDGLGLKYSEDEVLAVKLSDRPGALGKVTRKLAEKGIGIEYGYGSIAKGSKQALIVLGVTDIQAAARLVK